MADDKIQRGGLLYIERSGSMLTPKQEQFVKCIVFNGMNYSDAYFCKLFKQCFHVNFSTYLNEYRIEKARALMQNPRINIKDISIACGYSDPNYFTRVFKRLTGLTPTEYRLSCLNPE